MRNNPLKRAWRQATIWVTLTAFLAALLPPRRAAATANVVSDPSGGVPAGSGGNGPSRVAPDPALVDLSTGAAKTSFPFVLPTARGDAQPSLGLVYSSSRGVGFAGVGWTLNLPSIVRKGVAGIPQFADPVLNSTYAATGAYSLTFDDYLIDGQRLIPVALYSGGTLTTSSSATGQPNNVLPAALPTTTNWALFRREIDDGNRYYFNGKTWVMQTKAGHYVQFGFPLDSPIGSADVADQVTATAAGGPPHGCATNPIFRWNMVRDTDASGNTVYYNWGGQEALLSYAQTAPIEFLTDIYDTTAAPPVNLNTPGALASIATIPSSTFAHHTILTWELPNYSSYPTNTAYYYPTTTAPGYTVAPYAYSPIWAAPPYAQLAKVDVTSATWTSSTRMLVREYMLSYTTNYTQTRSYLKQIQQVGNCDGLGGVYETAITATAPGPSCAANEIAKSGSIPTTTFGYFNVSNESTAEAPSYLESPGYATKDWPVLLADLNGDSVAELVQQSGGNPTLDALYDPEDVAGDDQFIVPGSGNVWVNWAGPAQTSGSTFPLSSQNGLVTVESGGDWMWTLGVLGEWYPTGTLSELELVPYAFGSPSPTNPGTGNGTNYSGYPEAYGASPPPNLSPTYLGQIALGSSSATFDMLIEPQDPSLAAAKSLMTSSEPTPIPVGNVGAGHAFDVTGDGLPDLALVSLANSNVAAYFSYRNHGGLTLPMTLQAATFPAAPQLSPSNTAFGNDDGSMDCSYCWLGGCNPVATSCPVPGPSPSTYGTSYGLCKEMDFTPIFLCSPPMRAVADIDGDGINDLIVAQKEPSSWSPYGTATGAGYGPFVAMAVFPGRGDGRFGVPDVQNPTAAWAAYGAPYWPGQSGYAPSASGAGGGPQGDAVATNSMLDSIVRFGDLNGDGFADYAVLDSNGLSVCLRYGGYSDSAHWRCTVVSDPAIVGTYQSEDIMNNGLAANILIGDVDGSGINQVVYIPPLGKPGFSPDDATPSVTTTLIQVGAGGAPSSAGEGREGLLTDVYNGYGGHTTFTYDTVHHLNVGPLPVPQWVVTNVSTTNSLAGNQGVSRTTSYSYGTPIYDPRDRIFVGFNWVEQTTNSVSGSPGLVTKTWFATMTCLIEGTCDSGAVPYSVERASRGLVAAVETSENSSAGTRFTTTVNYYTPQAPYSAFDGSAGFDLQSINTYQYLWSSTDQPTPFTLLQPTIGAAPSLMIPSGNTHLTQTTNYDAYGDVVSTIDQGESTGGAAVDTPILKRLAWALPSADTSGWNLRPTQLLWGYSTDTTGATFTSPARELDYGYDSFGRLTSVIAQVSGTTATLPGVNGAARVAALPSDALINGAQDVLESIGYDGYGNITTLGTQEDPNLQTITPETVFNHLPQSISINPSDPYVPALISSFTYDRGLGEVTIQSSPTGAVSQVNYDDFGRPTAVLQPSAFTLGASVPAVSGVVYYDGNPIRTVVFQTVDGAESASGSSGGFTNIHYRYIDGLGELREAVDGIGGPGQAGATPSLWAASGLHMSYANGRVSTSYLPISGTGNMPTNGTLPPEASQLPLPGWPSTTVTYDGLGRIGTVLDPRGNTSQITYPTLLSAKFQDPEQLSGGHLHSYTTQTADGHGRLSTVDVHLNAASAGNGDIVTTYKYQDYLTQMLDDQPSVITQVSPAATVTRTAAYDSLGNRVVTTDPDTGTWSYAYNLAGQVIGTADPRGCGENIYRDGLGRKIAEDYIPCTSTQAAYSGPSDVSFDETNWPVPLSRGGTEVYYAYDGFGQLAQVWDRGGSTTFAYDPRGRVIAETRLPSQPCAAGVTGICYNLNTLNNEYIRRWGYSAANRVTSASAGARTLQLENASETLTYTFDGRLYSDVSPYGTIIAQQGYTPSGMLQSQTFGDAAATGNAYYYYADNSLNYITTGRGTGPWDPNGTVAYAPYPTVISSPASGTTTEGYLSYTQINRDMVGNPTSINDSSSTVPVVNTWPSTAAARSFNYTYYDDYRLASMTASSGVDAWQSPFAVGDDLSVMSSEYPAQNQPSTNERVNNQSFSYDWRGNITQSTDDANDFWDRSLGTTVMSGGPDRLYSATGGSGNALVTYDGAGNITQVAVTNGANSQTFEYTWDELGHLQSAAQVNPTSGVAQANEVYTYYAGGQRARTDDLVTGKSTVYVYDSLELRGATVFHNAWDVTNTPGQGQEHVYMAGGLAHLFYDVPEGMPQPAVTGATAPLASGTTFSTAAASGVVADGLTHLFLNIPDGQGSSAFVVDYDTGELVERTAYMPYGAIDTDYRTARWENFREDQKHTGNWDNAEVGLSYKNGRYYSPQLNRFISPDPLWIHAMVGDPNPYEYAYGNPVSHTDPSGLGEGDGSGQTNDNPPNDNQTPGAGQATSGGGPQCSGNCGSSDPQNTEGTGHPFTPVQLEFGPKASYVEPAEEIAGVGGSGGGASSCECSDSCPCVSLASGEASPAPAQEPSVIATAPQINWWRLFDPSGTGYAIVMNFRTALDPREATFDRVANGVLGAAAVLPIADVEALTVEGALGSGRAYSVAAEATQLELPLVEDATLTRGTFVRPDGSTVPLASGWKGGPGPSMPPGSPGFDIVTRTHVEGHAAALMQQEGLSSGRLFINNPTICPSCSKLLPSMLPTDSSLTVVLPDGTPISFTGN